MRQTSITLIVIGMLMLAAGGARAVASGPTGAEAPKRATWATIDQGTTPQGAHYAVRARQVRMNGLPGIKMEGETPLYTGGLIVSGSRRAFQQQVGAGISGAAVGGVDQYKIVYGTLPRKTRKAVVSLSGGSRMRVKPIRAPRSLKSLGVRFYVAALRDPSLDPKRVVALDRKGRRIASSSGV